MMSENWNTPPQSPKLNEDELHMWYATLDITTEQLDKYADSLSPDEIKRAERLVLAKDSQHFIAARGILREILGRYLNATPSQIAFHYSTQGKPDLKAPFASSGIQFNLSHSNDAALYAFNLHHNIGVDIEDTRKAFPGEAIAKRFFSPQEVETLLALPESERQTAFFHCWTRKEAFVKATGKGLSYPLKAFDVTLKPNDPPKILDIRENPPTSADWTLKSLHPTPNHTAAVAVQARPSHTHCWLLTKNDV